MAAHVHPRLTPLFLRHLKKRAKSLLKETRGTLRQNPGSPHTEWVNSRSPRSLKKASPKRMIHLQKRVQKRNLSTQIRARVATQTALNSLWAQHQNQLIYYSFCFVMLHFYTTFQYCWYLGKCLFLQYSRLKYDALFRWEKKNVSVKSVTSVPEHLLTLHSILMYLFKYVYVKYFLKLTMIINIYKWPSWILKPRVIPISCPLFQYYWKYSCVPFLSGFLAWSVDKDERLWILL